MLQYSLFFNSENSIKNSVKFLEESKLTYDPFFISSGELERFLADLNYFKSFVNAHKIFWNFNAENNETKFFITKQSSQLWLDSFGAFYNFPIYAKSKILQVYPYKLFFDELTPEGTIV